jgi:hypothetical protein
VLQRANHSIRMVISSETDVRQLLAESGAPGRSVTIFRREEHRQAAAQAALIAANPEQVQAELKPGAIAVLQATRVRVRQLLAWRRCEWSASIPRHRVDGFIRL